MLHVNDLTYRIGDRLILDRASFAIPTGARVGLVGRNGAGKTTLFRIVKGEVNPEDGSVSLPRAVRIGSVAQEAPSGPERLIDVVLAADVERTALLADAAEAAREGAHQEGGVEGERPGEDVEANGAGVREDDARRGEVVERGQRGDERFHRPLRVDTETAQIVMNC